MNDIAGELEKLWRRGIPLAEAMQIRIERCAPEGLTVAADLAPNINVHGTAFAGSLYAIAALTGWGTVWAALRAGRLEGDIVLAHGEIDYRRPVRDRIVCSSAWAEGAPGTLLSRLEREGRGAVRLECAIGSGTAAATFAGSYSIRRARPTASAP